MPELPEVETVRRGLAPVVEGRVFARVEVRRGDLRRPLPPRFAARLTGRRVARIDRRGKYLLFRLDGGLVLLVHLGMSGRLVIDRAGGGGGGGLAPHPGAHEVHAHVAFHLDSGKVVRFSDPRRFGLMDLVAAAALDRHALLAHLGIEPLEAAFDGPRLAALLAGKRTAIKAALLDQRLIAGLGNIYACEALFVAGLSPRRLAGSVQGERAARLAAAIRTVLAEAVAAGGSSLRDHVSATGELGYFQHHFKVYDREGRPCPGCTCGHTIRRIVQGGRSTFYCPVRQR